MDVLDHETTTEHLDPDTDLTGAPDAIGSEPKRSPAIRTLWIVLGLVIFLTGAVWGAINLLDLLAHGTTTTVNTYPAEGLTTVDIADRSGSVTVVGTDTDEIRVTATVSRGLWDTKEHQRVVADVLELGSSCPPTATWCDVDYRIEMPADLVLNVRADDGNIDVAGMSGALTLTADNGRIVGTDLRSERVTVDTDNGRAELRFVAPPTNVDADTDNGRLEIIVPDDGETYAVDAKTTWGTQTVGIKTDPASPRLIRARTSNGSLTLSTA